MILWDVRDVSNVGFNEDNQSFYGMFPMFDDTGGQWPPNFGGVGSIGMLEELDRLM